MDVISANRPGDFTLRADAVVTHLASRQHGRKRIIEMMDDQSKKVPGLNPSETMPPSPASIQTVNANARHRSLLRGSEKAERFEIGTGGVIGRDPRKATFQLNHPHVSRCHASLTVEGRRVTMIDLESSNGTYVNGRRIDRPTALRPGDHLDIGPFSLHFDGSGLNSRSRSNNIELSAQQVNRVVRNRASGAAQTLLNDVGLVVRPGEFVCLLGPSGSGKSTLLEILSGRNPPTTGVVSLNGEDLFANFEALKGDIAVVPQKDVLHDSLTVDAAIRYTAELRLPSDFSRSEVNASVADILEVVGLTERSSTLIRHLSGGQVKRASLANELVAGPSLLFLDEVTSGLDEQTDREVMGLFRQVADGGKTVVCITHSLANVEASCHLVAILTEGGRLAFVGTPDEAKGYFEISRLGDVYRKLAERTPQEWHELFRASSVFRRHVADRIPSDTASMPPGPTATVASGRRRTRFLRQTWVLTRRYVRVWQGDRQALLVLLGQGVLVALLLGLAFGNLDNVSNPFDRVQRTRNLLFLLTVSCFWFGCNTAAKEIVKERVIYQRERDYNLRVGSYLASKLLILSLISITQATLLFGIVRPWCHPPGAMGLQWATLAMLAVAGTFVGLFMSALARTEEVATALVPIAVIPQIILAGVITPLSGLGQWVSRAVVSLYWGQQTIERLLPSADLTLLGRQQQEWYVPWLMVLLHALASVIATFVVLKFTSARVRR